MWYYLVTEILVITGSSNGLAPIWCQTITWTSADLLSITLNIFKLDKIYFWKKNGHVDLALIVLIELYVYW